MAITRVIDRKYTAKCPSCDKERVVSYFTIWDIKNGKSTGKCRKCGVTPEHKERLRQVMMGNKVTLGFKHSSESKKVISIYSSRPRPDISGVKSPFWKGGITKANVKIRKSRDYRIWRKAVLERDCQICVWCGNDKNLEADHIKPFYLFPELRFAIDNGRTLCKDCHYKRHYKLN